MMQTYHIVVSTRNAGHVLILRDGLSQRLKLDTWKFRVSLDTDPTVFRLELLGTHDEHQQAKAYVSAYTRIGALV